MSSPPRRLPPLEKSPQTDPGNEQRQAQGKGNDVEAAIPSKEEHVKYVVVKLPYSFLRQWMDFCDMLVMEIYNGFLYFWEKVTKVVPILKEELFLNFLFVITFYVVCVVFYMHEEKWSLLDTVYFITCTISTIGYGDIAPTTDTSRVFTIFVILIGIFGVTVVMANFFGSLIKNMIDSCIDILYPNDKDSEDDITAPTHYVAKIGIVIFLFFSISVVSVLFLTQEHDETIIVGLYWTVVSITSVGYGDIALSTKQEKAFVIVFVMSSLFLVAAGMNIIFDVLAKERMRKKKPRNVARSPKTASKEPRKPREPEIS